MDGFEACITACEPPNHHKLRCRQANTGPEHQGGGAGRRRFSPHRAGAARPLGGVPSHLHNAEGGMETGSMSFRSLSVRLPACVMHPCACPARLMPMPFQRLAQQATFWWAAVARPAPPTPLRPRRPIRNEATQLDIMLLHMPAGSKREEACVPDRHAARRNVGKQSNERIQGGQ